MAKKKELTPKEIAWKIFLDDYEDGEIAERYERFLRDRESMKGVFNPEVLAFNEKLEKKQELEELLMRMLKLSHFDPECSILKEIRELEAELGALGSALAEARAEIDKNEELIKKYKDWAEKKLFEHWKYLRAFDPEVKDWASFKHKYNKVF